VGAERNTNIVTEDKGVSWMELSEVKTELAAIETRLNDFRGSL
jgi:hypothetical protein